MSESTSEIFQHMRHIVILQGGIIVCTWFLPITTAMVQNSPSADPSTSTLHYHTAIEIQVSIRDGLEPPEGS